MDILEELISLAQVSGRVNVKCQFQGAWQLEHSQSQQGIVHIVTQGSGYLRYPDSESIPIHRGDILFFPRGLEHSLSHHPEFAKNPSHLTAYPQGVFSIKQNMPQVTPDFSLFCACFQYDMQSELIQNLPEMMIVHLEPIQLEAVTCLLKWESEQISLGSQLIINHLATILLTLIIRDYLAQETQLLGIFSGWQDKRLKGLLQALIKYPEQDWSIDKMATFAHLSRSQFIRLFKQHLVTSPHAYLHKIRLQKSAMLLKQSADTILAVALSTGFQSETHFGKAFKAFYGMTPSQYRKMD